MSKEFIAQGLKLISDKFGPSSFLQYLAVSGDGRPVETPQELTLFALTASTKGGDWHAEITSTTPGKWGTPVQYKFPLTGVQKFEWPESINLSLDDAYEQIKSYWPHIEGIRVGMQKVTLSKAFPPKPKLHGRIVDTEPEYNFTVFGPILVLGHEEHRTVTVGAASGSVSATGWVVGQEKE
jgi:hypothetical protein